MCEDQRHAQGGQEGSGGSVGAARNGAQGTRCEGTRPEVVEALSGWGEHGVGVRDTEESI